MKFTELKEGPQVSLRTTYPEEIKKFFWWYKKKHREIFNETVKIEDLIILMALYGCDGMEKHILKKEKEILKKEPKINKYE